MAEGGARPKVYRKVVLTGDLPDFYDYVMSCENQAGVIMTMAYLGFRVSRLGNDDLIKAIVELLAGGHGKSASAETSEPKRRVTLDHGGGFD